MRPSAPLALLVLLPLVAWAEAPCVPTPQPQPLVQLAWQAPLLSPGQTLTAYQLQRQVNTSAWTDLPAPGASATTAQDTCAAGQTCAYRLYATGTDHGRVVRSPEAKHGTPCPSVQVAAAPPADVPQAFAASAACTPHCLELTWVRSDASRAVFVEGVPKPGTTLLRSVTVMGDSLVVSDLMGETEYCARAQYADRADEPDAWTAVACATTGR